MKPIFLLIQNGIVDIAESPGGLLFSAIDTDAGFQIAVGCINEDGEREIVGLAADVSAVDGVANWIVSSERDGLDIEMGGWGFAESFVRVRLAGQVAEGRFDDLANLPIPVSIRKGSYA